MAREVLLKIVMLIAHKSVVDIQKIAVNFNSYSNRTLILLLPQPSATFCLKKRTAPSGVGVQTSESKIFVLLCLGNNEPSNLFMLAVSSGEN